MKKSIWILAALLVLSFGFSSPQSRIVSGKVTSADDGSAIPGVNVVLKGTSTGVVTNAQGNYSITVPAQGGTLVFSFIGYSSRELENRNGEYAKCNAGIRSDFPQRGRGFRVFNKRKQRTQKSKNGGAGTIGGDV